MGIRDAGPQESTNFVPGFESCIHKFREKQFSVLYWPKIAAGCIKTNSTEERSSLCYSVKTAFFFLSSISQTKIENHTDLQHDAGNIFICRWSI